MLEPMHAAVGKPNGGAPSKVLTGKIHVVCHNKTQKLFARHCVLGGERGDQKIRCHGRIHPESNTSVECL